MTGGICRALAVPRTLGLPLALGLLTVLCAGGAHAAEPAQQETLRRQVMQAERAFAKTMADRDHAAFTKLLAEEAVFFAGQEPIRGRQKVAEAWKKFFAGPQPPFSWEPDTVAVLDSGTLALSSGPVRDPNGEVIGVFNSIWRLEAPGTWRVIFDKGCEVCQRCAPQP